MKRRKIWAEKRANLKPRSIDYKPFRKQHVDWYDRNVNGDVVGVVRNKVEVGKDQIVQNQAKRLRINSEIIFSGVWCQLSHFDMD